MTINIDALNCRKIWASVFYKSVEDLMVSWTQDHFDARAWILSKNTCFNSYNNLCVLFDIDAERVKRILAPGFKRARAVRKSIKERAETKAFPRKWPARQYTHKQALVKIQNMLGTHVQG